MRKNLKIAISMIVLTIILGGCAEKQQEMLRQPPTPTTTPEQILSSVVLGTNNQRVPEDFFSNRDYKTEIHDENPSVLIFDGNTAQIEGDGVVVTDNIFTITGEGSYILKGNLSDGQIIVDLKDETEKVQLLLDTVMLQCTYSAPISIVSADKVFITMMDGSENFINATISEENTLDAGIFSKCDLTLNGNGILNIEVKNGSGIVGKDELTITSGTYQVVAEGHGFDSNDGIAIAGGIFHLEVGKDGLHAEHKTNPEKGHIYILDGNFDIDCGQDALDSGYFLEITSGNFDILTNEGWENAPVKIATNNRGHQGGQTQGSDLVDEESIISRKGLKANGEIQIYGGEFLLNCYDDGIHGDSTVDIHGGDFHIFTADDGIHANWDLRIFDGKLVVERSFESLEGQRIYIGGGKIDLYSIDDGINAASQNPDPLNSDTYLIISDGTITLDSNAEGDGFDSNGTILIEGGEITISSTEKESDTTLDSDIASFITGGTFLGTGSNSRTLQNFSVGSTQGSIVVSLPKVQNETVQLEDNQGNIIVEFTPVKPFQTVTLSLSSIEQGKTYVVTIGDYSETIKMESLQHGGTQSGGRGDRDHHNGPR